MAKIIMANMKLNEEELELEISDIIRIPKVPDPVLQVIRENVKGRRLNKSGLPSVCYLGPNRVMVVGAFTYGDLTFLEVEGKWKYLEGDTLVCVTAYRPNKTYEELVEGKQEYLEELKEKYPDGLKVE